MSQAHTIPSDIEIEALLGRRSFLDFIDMAWSYVEPGIPFVPNWHIDELARHMEMLARREIRNLCVNIPPRSLKSTICSVLWPAWLWTFAPHTRIMSASYSAMLSTRDAVRTRRLVQSQWYQQRWGAKRPALPELLQNPPVVFAEDVDTKMRYETTSGGLRFATSVGGGVTGEGGDVLILDDPINVRDIRHENKIEVAREWWEQSWQSRVNDPKTAVKLVVMQRLTDLDTTAQIFEEEEGRETGEMNEDWVHVCFPMEYEEGAECPIEAPHRCTMNGTSKTEFTDPRSEHGELLHPNWIGETEIKKLRAAMNPSTWEGQYNQRPTAKGGLLIQRDWFPIAEYDPTEVTARCRAWDLAATDESEGGTPSWTVGLLLARTDNRFVIEDVIRMRGSAHKVRQMILATAHRDGRDVRIRLPQDPGQAGKSQAESFAMMLAGYKYKILRMTGDKITRAEPWIAAAEAGVLSVRAASWTAKLLSELTKFPVGVHDDQVDALSDAFDELADTPSTIAGGWTLRL